MNVCLYLQEEEFYLINASFLLIIAISYEFERTTLRLFIETNLAACARKSHDALNLLAGEMKVKHDFATRVNIELQGMYISYFKYDILHMI
jgi:hypothetical protein